MRRFDRRAFRRPATDAEVASFVALAKPAIEQRRKFVDVVKVPLRSMLSSPQLLLFDGKPGKLNDYALAARAWRRPGQSKTLAFRIGDARSPRPWFLGDVQEMQYATAGRSRRRNSATFCFDSRFGGQQFAGYGFGGDVLDSESREQRLWREVTAQIRAETSNCVTSRADMPLSGC